MADNKIIQRETNVNHADIKDLLLCCSCFCDSYSLYTKYPECLGVNCYKTCMCLSSEVSLFKASHVKGEYCVCAEIKCGQILPTTCCRAIGQALCLDCRMAFPTDDDLPCMLNACFLNLFYKDSFTCGCCGTGASLDEMWQKKQSGSVQLNKGDPSLTHKKSVKEVVVVSGRAKADDIYPFLGVGCCINSCYYKMPDIFGSDVRAEMCCISVEAICCKPSVEKGEIFTGEVCVFLDTRAACVEPVALVKGISQCFCIDSRCAIPCDKNDVPCLLNFGFINCCYEYETDCGCTLFKPLSQFLPPSATVPGNTVQASNPSKPTPTPTPTVNVIASAPKPAVAKPIGN